MQMARFAHLILIPPLFYILWLILGSGELPDNDYWGLLGQILHDDGFSSSVEDWFSRGNEHVVLVAKVLFAFNVWLTGGSNIAMGLMCVLIVLGQYMILWYLLPKSVRTQPVYAWVIAGILATFLFTPRAAHNWMLGMSGLCWFPANFFTIAAIASLYRCGHGQGNLKWWALAVFSALAATVSYSTGLIVWPLLLIMAMIHPMPLRYRMATAMPAIIVPIYMMLIFKRPGNHPEWVLDPGQIIGPVLYGVSNLTKNAQVPEGWTYVVGGLAILALITAGILLLCRSAEERKDILPWLLLASYSLGNLMIAAMGRIGLSPYALTASRYGALQALFWIGLFIAWLLLLRNKRRAGLFVVTAAAACMVVMMYRASWQHVQHLQARADLKPVAELALRMNVVDVDVFKAAVTPAYGQLLDIVPRLSLVGHRPFHVGENLCASIGDQLNETAHSAMSTIGRFEGLERVGETAAWRIGGRLISSATGSINCVAVTDEEGVVVGAGILTEKPQLGSAEGSGEQSWLAYATPAPTDRTLIVLGRALDDQWRYIGEGRIPVVHESSAEQGSDP